MTEAALSLAWLLSKENISTIPKSTDIAHLRSNFEAQAIEPDDETIERIDALHEYRQERVNNPDNPARKWQLPT